MATKKVLDDLLGGDDTPKKTIIRRGQGLRLSTESQSSNNEPLSEETGKSSSQLAYETNTVDNSQSLLETTTAEHSPQPRPETTTQPASSAKQSQKRTGAKSQNRTNAKSRSLADIPVKHKRVNRGYKLREDLIKACKRIALEEDRKLYEVMEEALVQYLAKK